MAGIPGTVYLIHFDRKFCHAQHYIGWTRYLEARLAHHLNGTGSKLMAAVSKAGISWAVVRTWDADGSFEQRLHKRKNSARLCPVCRAAKKERSNV